ncbi:MAG: PAS domain S-box protein [Desulfobulbaceae bacterium]|nr:PAS domain S-box protein [Desulfobulbaceae bacterium]
MQDAIYIGLINNAALLLSLGLLYELTGFRLKGSGSISQQLLIGFILGAIGIAIMLNPWSFGQGILFDTRSVLLCITGLFFGTIPTLLAMLFTGTFRVFLGGNGVLVGVAIIVSSGAIGLAWRHLRLHKGKAPSFAELYLLGVIVHLAMLAWMLMLPANTGLEVLKHISVPVLLIYPLATAILGKLMENRRIHKLADLRIKQSEEKFRNIFQHHSAAKLLIDPDTGKIIEANEAAGKFYGWSTSELKKKNIGDINDLTPDQVASEMAQAKAGNRTYFEFRHRTASGACKDVEVYSGTVTIDGHKYLHSIIHDITERKEAQRQLAERRQFLGSVIKTTADGFLVIDAAGFVTEVNDAYCAMSGFSRETLVGKYIGELDATESEEETKARLEHIKHHQALIFESTHYHADRDTFPVEISVSHIGDDNGTYVCFCRDLTARKQQEQQIAALGEMLDAAPVAVLLHDHDGKLIFANHAACIMHGYDNRETFMERNLREFMVPEMRASFPQRIKQISEKNELRFESTHVHRDGSHFPVDVIVRLIDWEGQRAYLAIKVDISEQQKAQEAITHSNELLRYIIEHANSAIAVHDCDLRYVYVSKNYLEQYKVSESEVIGKHHYEVFPDLPQKWRDVHQKALQGEISGSERDAYPRENGSIEWTRWSCLPWFEPDGAIGGFIVYTEVITDRVRAEEALRESEEYLRAMISAAPMAIISTDVEGVVQSWNIAAQRIFGWSEDEVYGHSPPFFSAKQQEEFFRLRQHVIRGETLSKIDQTRTRRDGSPVEVSLSAAPIYDAAGNVSGMLAMIEDISSYKRTKQERDDLQAQLIQAQKMESIGRLAGGVAHDYNNMLGVILGYTEMALEKLYEDDPLHKDLSEVLKAAERSADITRQLLAFSRQQTIAPKMLDFNEAIAKLKSMIRRLIGEDIEFIWHPGSDLWPIYMDPVQVDQILINLCVNARDAIADIGTISIETDKTTIDEEYCRNHYDFIPGDFVSLSITDNGCGMDRQTRDKLFEPFFTTKVRGKGTGLGLATVYGILKQNNCFINVYSEPGQGSTFTIYFPRYREKDQPAESKPALAHTNRQGHETILLLEDEKAILQMTTLMLKGLGYTVLACNTPNEALETAAKQPIQLLITDVVMPEMNGRELSERLKKHYPDLKTLFMSGYTANVIAHRGVLDKGVNFIQKPFSLSSLAGKTRDVLDT